MINLTEYKVKVLKFPNGEYSLGKSVPVIDEGSFYRIDGTHIFDKHKIKEIIPEGDKLRIEMKDKTVVLEVEHV